MAKKCYRRYRTLSCLVSITIASLLIFTKGYAAQVTLAWNPTDPEPDEYRIYQRVEGQAYDYENYSWNGEKTTADIDELDENRGYYFVVRAVVGEVESGDSNEVYFILEATSDSDDDATTEIDGDDYVTDSDNDGITDAEEELYGTSPSNSDTDGDGIQDGTEIGLTLADIGSDTDLDFFIPDADPTTTTDPTDSDSDNDCILDGDEDVNHNGMVDGQESDPNAAPKKKRDVLFQCLQMLLLEAKNK